MSETTPPQNLRFEYRWRRSVKSTLNKRAQIETLMSQRHCTVHRRVLRTLSGWPEATWAAWATSDLHEMVIFWSKIDFFKKYPDRSESVIYDQEMYQSLQFSDFKLDRWTFTMFLEDPKKHHFFEHKVNFCSTVKFCKMYPDSCKSVTFDQEIRQRAEFCYFNVDWLTFIMIFEDF